jgi:CheY-like chemotaxis protein
MGVVTSVAKCLFQGVMGKSRTVEVKAVLDREHAAYSRYMDESRTLRIQMRSEGTYLILEDDPSISKLLQVIIRSCGRKVVAVACIHDAIAYLEEHGAAEIACCVVDLRLPDGDGESLISLLEKKYQGVPILVYTGSTDRIKDIQQAHPKVRVLRKGMHDGVRTLMQALALPDREVRMEVNPG